MINELINYRATIFITDNRLLNSQDLNTLNPLMQEFELMPSTNNQVSFQITPNGILPMEGLAVELRNNNGSFKIMFGPGRIDIVRNKIAETDSLEDINNFIEKVLRVIELLKQSYNNWIVIRLALGTNVCYDLDSRKLISAYKKITNQDSENLVEWKLHKVIRKSMETGSQVIVNQASTISRSMIQVPFQPIPVDRVFLETDFNTMVGLQVGFTSEIISSFWQKTILDTLTLIDEYNTVLTSE